MMEDADIGVYEAFEVFLEEHDVWQDRDGDFHHHNDSSRKFRNENGLKARLSEENE